MTRDTKSYFINGLIESAIDSQVYQDVRRTYARECISLIKHGNLSITNTHPRLIKRTEYTECEISPFHHDDIDCAYLHPKEFIRKPSTTQFSSRTIPFELVKQFLVDSFSPSEKDTRAYPSAGALYPVEPLIFLFPEKIQEFQNNPSGCYHFRPGSKKLQLIQKMELHPMYTELLHGFVGENPDAWPSFAVLYLAHIGKAIFKYRYRGYRHAMMEAGSMYQQATYIAQQMDLSTTVWSTFSEQQMLFKLGLDHGTYMPLTMQLFGYGD